MNEIFTLNDAIDRLNFLSSSETVYWNVYITVSLGVLGMLGTEYSKKQTGEFHLYFIFGYAIFLVANAYEIFMFQTHIFNISKSIISYVGKHQDRIDSNLLPIFDNLPTIHPIVVLAFHLGIGILILFLLYRAYKNSTSTK